MDNVRAMALTAAELQPFGHLLSDSNAPIPTDEGFGFGLTVSDLPISKNLCTGLLVCEPRSTAVSKMERHLKTPEILVALEGDSLLCLAPPTAKTKDLHKASKAFMVRQGEALVLHPGTWHWIPFPLGDTPSRFLVIFRRETGEDDLDYATLLEPIELTI